MHPEGRLFIGTTNNATSTLARKSGPTRWTPRGFLSCSCQKMVRRRHRRDRAGYGALIQAEHPVVVVDDVLTPPCDVIDGRISYERDSTSETRELLL